MKSEDQWVQNRLSLLMISIVLQFWFILIYKIFNFLSKFSTDSSLLFQHHRCDTLQLKGPKWNVEIKGVC